MTLAAYVAHNMYSYCMCTSEASKCKKWSLEFIGIHYILYVQVSVTAMCVRVCDGGDRCSSPADIHVIITNAMKPI